MIKRSAVVWRILAALLVVGLLIGAGALVYRAGFSQGFAQAALAAGEEGERAVPGFPYYRGHYPGFFWPRFGFFPGFPLFGVFFFGLFLLFLLRGLFRPWVWGPHGHWHTHPHSWGPQQDPARPQGETGAGNRPGDPGQGQS